ncbi:hypothetical protein QCA50_008700 [Cerrena zonata]|uniref:Uncharacterized protein n=1 Tax=Cerrena zonata TaxID=2478898 RepID=A0AAW0G3Q4_9APHY
MSQALPKADFIAFLKDLLDAGLPLHEPPTLNVPEDPDRHFEWNMRYERTLALFYPAQRSVTTMYTFSNMIEATLLNVRSGRIARELELPVSPFHRCDPVSRYT